MTILPIFPTLLYSCNVPVPKNLVKYTLKLSKEEKGEHTSNRGGWHSRYDLNEDEHFVKNYLTYLGTSLTKELGDIPLFSFVNMWLNLNRKGDYNVMHNHPDCHYSLVWFIKTPKNCGDLV